MYSIIVLFGDSKSAFTASAFLSVLVGYALMVIEFLSIGSLIAFIGLVVVGIAFMMVSNQSWEGFKMYMNKKSRSKMCKSATCEAEKFLKNSGVLKKSEMKGMKKKKY